MPLTRKQKIAIAAKKKVDSSEALPLHYFGIAEVAREEAQQTPKNCMHVVCEEKITFKEREQDLYNAAMHFFPYQYQSLNAAVMNQKVTVEKAFDKLYPAIDKAYKVEKALKALDAAN